jgi:very-short-patch-repair endonuclease
LHYNGSGCPVCSAKHLEIKIHNLLTNSNIAFNTEKKFDWLSSPNNGKMRLDFYLPEHNIAIECQGIQHYQPVDYFGGEEQFKKQKVYDSQKYKLCKKNGICVLYFTDESLLDLVPKKYKDITFTSIEDLLTEIKKSQVVAS